MSCISSASGYATSFDAKMQRVPPAKLDLTHSLRNLPVSRVKPTIAAMPERLLHPKHVPSCKRNTKLTRDLRSFQHIRAYKRLCAMGSDMRVILQGGTVGVMYL